MIRDTIKSQLKKVLLNLGIEIEPEVLSTTDPQFGDYYSNILLKLKKELSQQEWSKTAKEVEAKFNENGKEFTAQIAPNGLLNFTLSGNSLVNQLQNILNQKERFGASDFGKGKKASVEFVSANPTGPLHFGNARGGPIGDSLAKILEFHGWKVLREYIHNDVGGQVERLGESMINVSKGKSLEQQEYKGEYIKELVEKVGDVKDAAQAGKKAVDIMLEEILDDAKLLGIEFDRVLSESSLASSGKTQAVLEQLKKKGFLKEQDGAVWFAPQDKFLEDREAVVIKSDGSFTYFADDIAYHKEKFLEKPDLVVDIFGADHHGHVPKLQAASAALGFDNENFKVILYQWVRFKKGDEVLKTSKRSGNIVTAKEVLNQVGKDAVRFFILMHDANSSIDFDLELAKKNSNENPVYYVQYAHARASNILKNAEKVNISLENTVIDEKRLLESESTKAIIRQLLKFPELLEDVVDPGKNFPIHLLPQYSLKLADLFHKFYEKERVITSDEKQDMTKLATVQAVQTLLRSSLQLIGASAPERMSERASGDESL